MWLPERKCRIVDVKAQDIRADKQREARLMKEQIERRRELRKSRDENILAMIKALEKRGMSSSDIIATIADMRSITQTEAQKYYDQLVVTS